jgi:oligoendopeptidase F
MSTAVLPRDQMAPEYTWDTASVFPNDQAWEAEITRIIDALPGIERFQGHLGDSPATLLAWFETSERLLNAAHRVYFYASMFHNTNTADQQAAAKDDRASGLIARR